MDKQATFDGEAFYRDLDRHREERKLSWKQVADKAGVTQSTLTRLGQGKRPDVDGLAALCTWAGLNANDYFATANRVEANPVNAIGALLRADAKLSPKAAEALNDLIQTAYEHFRES